MHHLEPQPRDSSNEEVTRSVNRRLLLGWFLGFLVVSVALIIVVASGGLTTTLADCTTIAQVNDVRFSPDGTVLATAHGKGFIRFWNVESQRTIGRIDDKTSNTDFTSIAFAPDGDVIAAGGSDAAVSIWDVQSERQITRFKPETVKVDSVRSLVFSPDGMTLAVLNTWGSIWFWNRRTGGYSRVPADDESHFYSSMAFSPDGALFITGEETGEIKGWLRPAMNLAFTWKVHAGYVNKLAFSADGKRLASAAVIEKGFEFDEIMLWEFDTGREIAQFTEHSRELLSLEFAADSTLLVASDSFNIIVWNTLTRHCPVQRESMRRPALVEHSAFPSLMR